MGPLPTHSWTLPNSILIESQVLSKILDTLLISDWQVSLAYATIFLCILLLQYIFKLIPCSELSFRGPNLGLHHMLTFLGYSMPNLFFYKNSSSTIWSIAGRIRGFVPLSESERNSTTGVWTHYDCAVQCFNHYTMRTPPKANWMSDRSRNRKVTYSWKIYTTAPVSTEIITYWKIVFVCLIISPSIQKSLLLLLS